MMSDHRQQQGIDMKQPIRTIRLQRLLTFATVMTAAWFTTGCATKGYVRTEVAAANERITEVQDQVETNQDQLATHDQELEEQSRQIEEVSVAATGASQTAREALGRAIDAGKLAEGKLLFETVLSEDKIRFGSDQTELGTEADAALGAFVQLLKAANENVYIEIQGHTDAVGAESYNMALGEKRAQAVRRALNASHGLPLHKMSVISYGESAPIADNGTRDGRARNRRVVLVVLK